MGWQGERHGASIGAGNASHGSIAAFRTFFGSHSSAKSLPITLPFAEIIAGLNDYKPTHLIVYPSMLRRLALEK